MMCDLSAGRFGAGKINCGARASGRTDHFASIAKPPARDFEAVLFTAHARLIVDNVVDLECGFVAYASYEQMAATVSARVSEHIGKPQAKHDLIERHYGTPASPKTPLAGRSISAAYESPGSYNRDSDEVVIYELDPRELKAGWAGESVPRCIWRFGYARNDSARVGDYSSYTAGRKPSSMKDHVLYQADLRNADLSLIRSKFERALRAVHLEHLQLNQKSKKAALIVSPLTSTKMIELALGVLFDHYTQPPSITLLPMPIMSCIGAGLRHGLVIDIGWEETIVSAVGEYRRVVERRSIRGGKALIEAIIDLLRCEATKSSKQKLIDFALAEEVKNRLAWCANETTPPEVKAKHLDIPVSHDTTLSIAFGSLSEAVHTALFGTESTAYAVVVPDDDDYGIPLLAYSVLRDLPRDMRGVCAERIIIDGSHSRIPGLRRSILERVQSMIDARGWNIVVGPQSRDVFETPRAGSPMQTPRAGSAVGTPANTDDVPAEPSTENTTSATPSTEVSPHVLAATDTLSGVALDGGAEPAQGSLAAALIARSIPAGLRPQDDVKDHITQKAERKSKKWQVRSFSGRVRGVESLGAWAGASTAMSLKVKVKEKDDECEIERDDFMRHGLRDSISLLI